jgi:hypothetical protein
MLANPGTGDHLRRAAEIATEVKPVLYRVASVEDRAAAK